MIPLFSVGMNPNINVTPTLLSGMVSQGPRVEEFEKKLKERFDTPWIATVNSATSGLTLAYRLLNLSPGDVVISTPFTCIATNTPIVNSGLRIRWADTDPKTCNIDLDDVVRKLSKEVKALSIVHWAGHPVDYHKLEQVKQVYRERYQSELMVIEDCAHAFGSKYQGKPLGVGYGNIAVYSFQAVKHLTTVDGGMIILPNQQLYDRAILLRWFGIDRVKRNGGGDFRLEVDVPEAGYKFHMNDLNAAIGLSNLETVDAHIQAHRDNSLFYHRSLKGIPGVTQIDLSEESACWIYTFQIVGKAGFLDYAKKRGVMVSQVHNRNDIHSCFAEFKADLPQLDSLEKRVISIPNGWWVTHEQRSYIVEVITDWCTKEIQTVQLTGFDFAELAPLYQHITSFSPRQDLYFKTIKEGAIYLGLRYQNKLIGVGKIWTETKLHRPVVHLEDIMIHHDFQKQGFGTLLVQKMAEEARKLGGYKIVLSCRKKNEGFYTTVGFQPSGLEMVMFP